LIEWICKSKGKIINKGLHRNKKVLPLCSIAVVQFSPDKKQPPLKTYGKPTARSGIVFIKDQSRWKCLSREIYGGIMNSEK